MLKPSLQLKLGQTLTMTPQLQQAIRLLQLSALELSTEIQEALDSNMMLEVADGEDASGDDTPPGDQDAATDESAADAEIEAPFEVGGGDPALGELRGLPQERRGDRGGDQDDHRLEQPGARAGRHAA